MNTIKTISNKFRFYYPIFLSIFLLQNIMLLKAQELPCANEIFQSNQLKDTAFLRQFRCSNLFCR